MNKFLKGLIISLIIFVIHLIAFSITHYFKNSNFGYYGLLGGVAYAFIFGFWVYYILTMIYLFITKSVKTTLMKLVFAFFTATIGYFIARSGDIIDGDFERKFDSVFLLTFMLSSFLLVLLDRFLSRRKNST